MKVKAVLFTLIILMNCTLAQTNRIDSAGLWGSPPDSIPKIFAKGIISLPDRYEYGLAISSDLDEILFTAEPSKGLLVMRKLSGEYWLQPETARYELTVSAGYLIKYNI